MCVALQQPIQSNELPVHYKEPESAPALLSQAAHRNACQYITGAVVFLMPVHQRCVPLWLGNAPMHTQCTTMHCSNMHVNPDSKQLCCKFENDLLSYC